METKTCFVCLDATPPLHQACACNMHVHAACLQETVRRVPAHRTRCPVCMRAYPVRAKGTCARLSVDILYCLVFLGFLVYLVFAPDVYAILGITMVAFLAPTQRAPVCAPVLDVAQRV